MSYNFSLMQQSFDRLLQNSAEAIAKWREFVLDPAKDMTVQYYDANGNLVTTTIPNRQKFVNDISADFNSIMQKTVYVDQVNGNDGNDGTQQRPFKTLQRAVSSIPAGGDIDIQVIGNYFLDNDVVITQGRNVKITINGKITTRWLTNSSGQSTRSTRFNVIGYSSLTFFSGPNLFEIEVPPPPNFATGVTYDGGFIASPDLYSGSALIRPNDNAIQKITLNNTSLFRVTSGIGNFVAHFVNNSTNTSFVFNNAFVFGNEEGIINGRIKFAKPPVKNEQTVNNDNFISQLVQGYTVTIGSSTITPNVIRWRIG